MSLEIRQDSTIMVALWGTVSEGTLLQAGSYDFIITDIVANLHGTEWFPDDAFLHYDPELDLLRYSFFQEGTIMVQYYYFTRIY
jgi:hypothetical protein